MPLSLFWGLDLLTVSPFNLCCWITKQASWPTLPDVVTVWPSGADGGLGREAQILQFPLPWKNGLQFSDCVGASEDLQAWEASRVLLISYRRGSYSENTASRLIIKLQVLPKERNVRNIIKFQQFPKRGILGAVVLFLLKTLLLLKSNVTGEKRDHFTKLNLEQV